MSEDKVSDQQHECAAEKQRECYQPPETVRVGSIRQLTHGYGYELVEHLVNTYQTG
jgi:hypothetical protein